jgi:hypothetical protein
MSIPISGTPAQKRVQPAFEAIVRNAVSLCGSLFANVFRFDRELLHFVAQRGPKLRGYAAIPAAE